MNNYRTLIYDAYNSNGFAAIHTNEKAYRIQKKYFEKNYLKRGLLSTEKKIKICDLGCGCGEFTRCLSDNGYTGLIIGVDTSHETIQYCKSLNIPNVTYECNNISNFLKETEQIFDVFIFNDVIEHLYKDEIIEILNLMKDKLSCNGCIYIKTPNMANPYVNTAGRYIDFTHEIGFTEHSMKQILRAVGLDRIEIYGTDIYVFNPIISIISKSVSKIINFFLLIFSYLYGRTSIHIFEKDILAIAYKD